MTLVFLSYQKSTGAAYAISDILLSKKKNMIEWDGFPEDHEYHLWDIYEHAGKATKSILISDHVIALWSGHYLFARSNIMEIARRGNGDTSAIINAAIEIFEERQHEDSETAIVACPDRVVRLQS